MQNQITHIHLETITSTNTWAKENYLRLDPNHITCITASEQTGGRGQLNRAWISPKDLNLYLTYFFTLEKMAPIQNLAQLLSLSAAKCLESYHLTPQIKWPNDLLIQNKKIAGVLCEIIDLNHMNGIILGIG